MRKLRSNQGFILALAMRQQLVAAIFENTTLALAISQGQQAQFFHRQTSDRYLAEAAMAIAYSQLTLNPLWCPPGPPASTVSVDTDGNGIGDTPVTIVMTPACGAPGAHNIQAIVLTPY